MIYLNECLDNVAGFFIVIFIVDLKPFYIPSTRQFEHFQRFDRIFGVLHGLLRITKPIQRLHIHLYLQTQTRRTLLYFGLRIYDTAQLGKKSRKNSSWTST